MSFRLSEEAATILRRGEEQTGVKRSAIVELALRFWGEHHLKPEAAGKPKKKSGKSP